MPLTIPGRINIYNINNGGSLFRMSADLTMNYSIYLEKNGKKQKDTNEQSQRNGGRDDDLFGANTILNDNRRSQFDGAEEGGEDKISEFLTQNYHGI
jgi:hypothetical protein